MEITLEVPDVVKLDKNQVAFKDRDGVLHLYACSSDRFGRRIGEQPQHRHIIELLHSMGFGTQNIYKMMAAVNWDRKE